MAKKRIQRELGQVLESVKNIPEIKDISLKQDDIFSWRFILQGGDLETSKFRGGIEILQFDCPRDYPFKPPKTTIYSNSYHVNDLNENNQLTTLSDTPNPNSNNNSQGEIYQFCSGCMLCPYDDSWSPAKSLVTHLSEYLQNMKSQERHCHIKLSNLAERDDDFLHLDPQLSRYIFVPRHLWNPVWVSIPLTRWLHRRDYLMMLSYSGFLGTESSYSLHQQSQQQQTHEEEEKGGNEEGKEIHETTRKRLSHAAILVFEVKL